MTVMGQKEHEHGDDVTRRVAKALRRCVRWSQTGRHRKVLREMEELRRLVDERPLLEAQILVWKAQALLALGCPDRALPAASRSWELDASPHACHLMSVALHGLGDSDRAEELLQMGRQLFPDAVHLPLQLAMLLADQGRVPEAIDTLSEVAPEDDVPQELAVFLFGLRANLLASVGRWREADALLREGLDEHPDAPLLQETHETLHRGWMRSRSEEALADSWQASLEDMSGVGAEVDEAIERAASVLEVPRLRALAARRLWRALLTAEQVRPQAPDAWAAGLLAAVSELDGDLGSVAAMARGVGARAATTRSALARARSYVSRLEEEFARRSFAASTNPRLEETDLTADRGRSKGELLPFPEPDASWRS